MDALTLAHVVISLIGIATGFVVVFGMMGGKRLDSWTAIFLLTTVLTSATGFLFAVDKFLPSHAVGILSLIALALAITARYSFKLSGSWRRMYVITAVISLYLNCFVLVVQLFLKVPFLHEMAPNGSEPPFGISQGAVLILFIWLGLRSVRGFRTA